MTDALIGSTGFVGSNLSRAHRFDASFNSRTMDNSAGGRFSLAVCAAAPATMWAANKDPEGDRATIEHLIGQLNAIKADRFVLISTIAVLKDASAAFDEASTEFETEKAYGTHRRMLETACQDMFDKCLILRLPALFGHGLKKNFIFDLLNPAPSFLTKERYADLLAQLPETTRQALETLYSWNAQTNMHACDRAALAQRTDRRAIESAIEDAGFAAVNFTNSMSTFQFYGLDRLWDDIQRCFSEGLTLVHMAPEPLSAATIHHELTGKVFNGSTAGLYHEDMRSRHADLWNGAGGYMIDRLHVLSALKTFYEQSMTP